MNDLPFIVEYICFGIHLVRQHTLQQTDLLLAQYVLTNQKKVTLMLAKLMFPERSSLTFKLFVITIL